jgi:hypothetical protein
MTRRIASLAAVASASVTMLALLPATAPANSCTFCGTSASINFVGYAHLQEDKTAMVTVVYQCQPSTLGPIGEVAAGLEQEGAKGEAREPAKCDGQKHSLTLDVAPGPFKRGTAAAVAAVGNGAFVGSGFSVAERTAELQVK